MALQFLREVFKLRLSDRHLQNLIMLKLLSEWSLFIFGVDMVVHFHHRLSYRKLDSLRVKYQYQLADFIVRLASDARRRNCFHLIVWPAT
jgi:hypothetical protein